MTLKYLRIMGIHDEYGFSDSDLHIPMDDYILTAMRKSKDEKICSSYKVKGLGIKDNDKWSQIENYSTYYKYQSKVRIELNKIDVIPIEWESQAWIAEATERANKE